MVLRWKLKSVSFLLLLFSSKCFSEKLLFQISHCNDLSGQLEPFLEEPAYSTKAPKPCTQDDALGCIGGITNLVNHLHSIDEKYMEKDQITKDNHFILTAGNLIGGESGWIPSKKGNGWAAFGDLVRDYIKPNASAFGMKEFGAGLKQTLKLFSKPENSAETPPPEDIYTLVNGCNNDAGHGVTEKEFCANYTIPSPSVKILNVPNSASKAEPYRIGVVGFTDPLAERLSLPGSLKFDAIVNSIENALADASVSDIKTFIAIGDGSLSIAKSIMDAVPKVKIVLYSSGFSTLTDMSGSYPLKYKQRFIGTAGKYGSSVGKMVLTVDTDTGNLMLENGRLTTTTYKVEPDKVDLKTWRSEVDTAIKNTMGYTHVKLSGGELCWRQECNLGNLMADAVVHCVLAHANHTMLDKPLHAVWHGGAFFEDEIQPGSRINEFDIHKWLPYHNNVHLVNVTGANLRKLFDISATGLNPQAAGNKDWRYFLQVSNGFEVYYDTKSKKVPQVTKIRMNHDLDGVPVVKDIQETNNMTYFLAIPTYLYEMRGYYKFHENIWGDVTWGLVNNSYAGFDDTCLGNYIKAMGIITIGTEERIFLNKESGGGGGGSGGGGGGSGGGGGIPDTPKQRKHVVTVILTIVFYSIFLVVIFIGYFFVIPRLRQQTSRVEYPPNQL